MLSYLATLGLLLYIGMQLHLLWPYYAGLLVAGMIAAYHYTLIRRRERGACFKAFLHNNWLGAAVFAGVFASYWI
jgi:4-hydroxybenzoate polyprenyltransferase